MNPAFSPLERKILDLIQTDFPLTADPYTDIAASARCTRDEAHATVVSLRRRGIIRRIGGVFVSGKLGYKSCLVAARVDPSRIETVAARASAYAEVTHNYERNGFYNLWFTIIAENTEKIEKIIGDVRSCEGVEAVHAIPALNTFKIKVAFNFNGEC